jgi:hypothetical protein
MPCNLHLSTEVDKPPHVPIPELPEFFQSLTATQMVQAAIGLDLPVAALLDISVSLVA